MVADLLPDWRKTRNQLLEEISALRKAVAKLERLEAEHLRVEAELRANQQRFELVAQATNDAVWDWDLTDNCVWWNEGITSLFGYPKDVVEPHGEWWKERIHLADQQRVVLSLHHVIEGVGDTWFDEYRFRCYNDSYAYVIDRGYVVRQDGRAIRMIGCMTDLTKRHVAEEALRLEKDNLEQLNRIMLDREQRVVGLKAEVNALLMELQRGKKYVL